jgi:aminopeptidase N
VTYSRGALVLHKLRGELGDAVFWDAIRRYVSARAGRGATSDDFRAALEAASGHDLGPFFARWVYATAPDL